MSAQDFRPTFPVLTKVSNYKIKKLNLRHSRVSIFPLCANNLKGSYLLPKKECLKYTKKFLFGITADSSKFQSIQILNHVKSARPTSFTISLTGRYKITDKLDMFQWLNNISNLQSMTFSIEGGLIEAEVAKLFSDLLNRAPNLTSLAFDFKRCSLKQETMNMILDGLIIATKLISFVCNVSSADVGDQEILHIVEALSEQTSKSNKLKSLIISLKANRKVTDEGLNILSKLVAYFQGLVTFKIDVVGTSVTAESLTSLLDSLKEKRTLNTFFLHAGEVSNLSTVLENFFAEQQSLQEISLDLSHDSEITLETLNRIQNSVAKLPDLRKYQLNVDGCHSLGECGTFFVPESLSLFQSLKELEVHFASYLENGDQGQLALENLVRSMSMLNQLESLSFDFSSCSDWFTESDSQIQERFLQAFPLMRNLKRLSLNFKKSQINPETLQVLWNSLSELVQLKSLELDLGFCKSIKEKDLRAILLYLSGSLKLTTLQIYADDISYDENKLSQDIHLAVKSSQTLRELAISLKKTLMGRQAASMVSKFEPKHPGFDLVIVGGQAFTLIKPGTKNVFKPPVRSIFGK